jgi:hypothetical protein
MMEGGPTSEPPNINRKAVEDGVVVSSRFLKVSKVPL